jgi:NAD(P)-dependent dehydrogenase (short-subunit alcohol dehydrogenase family)
VKHVLLVGATDGLGLALAKGCLERGWRICVAGRDWKKLEGTLDILRRARGAESVSGVVCDVTDPASIDRAFAGALRTLGSLDLIIYCAGVMPPAGTSRERLAGAGETLAVNTLGAILFLERAAEHMRVSGGGRLAAIGSVAGVRGRKGNPVYGASKAALHAYLEGLRHRLHSSGVGVSTVKPGFLRTRMLGDKAPRFPPATAPEDAARRILDGLERGRDEFFVPWWWAWIAIGLRLLPTPLHKRFAPP